MIHKFLVEVDDHDDRNFDANVYEYWLLTRALPTDFTSLKITVLHWDATDYRPLNSALAAWSQAIITGQAHHKDFTSAIQ